VKRILGVDPGKNTGYALVTVDGRDIQPTGTVGVDRNESIQSIQDIVKDRLVDILVVEDFKVRPGMARGGKFDYSDMVAPRVIGKLELLAELSGLEIVKQQASLKPPAYGFAGLKYSPGKKGTHWQDAFAHAVYYCVKELGAKPIPRGSS
jgi:hypothetical protein